MSTVHHIHSVWSSGHKVFSFLPSSQPLFLRPLEWSIIHMVSGEEGTAAGRNSPPPACNNGIVREFSVCLHPPRQVSSPPCLAPACPPTGWHSMPGISPACPPARQWQPLRPWFAMALVLPRWLRLPFHGGQVSSSCLPCPNGIYIYMEKQPGGQAGAGRPQPLPSLACPCLPSPACLPAAEHEWRAGSR